MKVIVFAFSLNKTYLSGAYSLSLFLSLFLSLSLSPTGAGLLLLLIIVIVVVLICRCRHRKRQYKVTEKRHKELKQDVKEWENTKEENDYKDRIYDLPVQPKKQPRFQRMDSTL